MDINDDGSQAAAGTRITSASYEACYVLRVTCCVLRVTCYVLRVTCYVLHVTCYVSRVTFYVLPDSSFEPIGRHHRGGEGGGHFANLRLRREQINK